MKDHNLQEGIEQYLEQNDIKDKFQSAELGRYHFPCSECIHKDGEIEYCKDCRHYII